MSSIVLLRSADTGNAVTESPLRHGVRHRRKPLILLAFFFFLFIYDLYDNIYINNK